MVENLREKDFIASEGMFNNTKTLEIEGDRYHMEYTSLQNLRKFNIDGYNYIEQNPEKGSHWAKRALTTLKEVTK